MPKSQTKKEPTTYAFIDSQNLNLGIRELGWKLDNQRFRIYLKEKYNVTKAFLFIGYMPQMPIYTLSSRKLDLSVFSDQHLPTTTEQQKVIATQNSF